MHETLLNERSLLLSSGRALDIGMLNKIAPIHFIIMYLFFLKAKPPNKKSLNVHLFLDEIIFKNKFHKYFPIFQLKFNFQWFLKVRLRLMNSPSWYYLPFVYDIFIDILLSWG